MSVSGTAELIVERDQVLITDDGVALRADVYRPAVDHPVPAVLTRTPYDKGRAVTVAAGLDVDRAVAAGLAVVCQDVRGRFASGGEFVPFRHEAADGRATVEWLAAQPWCSGRIGMAGRSYAAATQWLAAATGVDQLLALCPIVGASDPYSGAAYQGGAFQLGANLFWAHLILSGGRSRAEVRHAYRQLPLRDVQLFHGTPADFYYDWLDHPQRDAYWDGVGVDRSRLRPDLAVFNVGGWYDPFLAGTLDNFSARPAGQRLLIGPWGHGGAWGSYPDHTVPGMPGSDIDLTGMQVDFFRSVLLAGTGQLADVEDPSPAADVQLYVMGGGGHWLQTPQWPPADVSPQPWYLRAGGVLATEPPGTEPPDRFRYDPADPTPTVGGPLMMPASLLGSSFGPLDRSLVEARPDVLCYTSAAVAGEAMLLAGPVTVVLFAETSAPDTDYVAALSVVDEQGGSRILTEGIQRARYRHGCRSAVPVPVGEVMRIEIDLVATATAVAVGQRIRLTVASSSFPRFDRNLNTGGPQACETLAAARTADQTVHHDGAHASHVVLPVLDRLTNVSSCV